MEFTINAAALASVLPLAATDKIRPMLNGFLCRADGVLIATNGYALGMRRAAHTSTQDIIIRPNAELKRLIKTATRKRAPAPDVTVATHDPLVDISKSWSTVTVSYFGVSVECDIVEGPYPNVSHVFPRRSRETPEEGAGQGITLDPKLLAAFGDYARLTFISNKRAIVVHTKDPDFVGLLMPKRVDDGHIIPDVPDWVVEDETVASAIPAAA